MYDLDPNPLTIEELRALQKLMQRAILQERVVATYDRHDDPYETVQTCTVSTHLDNKMKRLIVWLEPDARLDDDWQPWPADQPADETEEESC